ncbi:MAG: hypothetical protein QW348_00370 [Ignisphaera sp.]
MGLAKELAVIRDASGVVDVDVECADNRVVVRVTFLGSVSVGEIGRAVGALARVFKGYRLSGVSISSPSFIDVFIEFVRGGDRDG